MYISQLIVSCLWPKNYICPIRYKNKYKIVNMKKWNEQRYKDNHNLLWSQSLQILPFVTKHKSTKDTDKTKYLEFNMRNWDMAGRRVSQIYFRNICPAQYKSNQMLCQYIFVYVTLCVWLPRQMWMLDPNSGWRQPSCHPSCPFLSPPKRINSCNRLASFEAMLVGNSVDPVSQRVTDRCRVYDSCGDVFLRKAP